MCVCVFVCIYTYTCLRIYIESYEIIRWMILGGARTKKIRRIQTGYEFSRTVKDFICILDFSPFFVSGISRSRAIFFPGKKQRPAGDISPATVPARFHFPRFDGRLTNRERAFRRYFVFYVFSFRPCDNSQ